MTTMPLGSNISTRPSLTWTWRNLHDGATCTTHRRASVSLKARLKKPSVTCFHVKQTARSQRVSCTILPPSVLWHTWQTEACLVLRPKPRNRRGDFEAKIIKLELSVLRPKLRNPKPPILRPNQEKPPSLILRSNRRKSWPPVLRSNRRKPP
jgi:hypothetical protein